MSVEGTVRMKKRTESGQKKARNSERFSSWRRTDPAMPKDECTSDVERGETMDVGVTVRLRRRGPRQPQ